MLENDDDDDLFFWPNPFSPFYLLNLSKNLNLLFESASASKINPPKISVGAKISKIKKTPNHGKIFVNITR